MRLAITFLILSFSSNIFPQNKIDSLIKVGLNYSYSFEFDQAEDIFNRVIELNPELPVGYYFLSQISLWKFMGGNDEGDHGVFLKYADLSIEKGEKQLDEKETAELNFYVGSAYKLKVIALIYKGEFFDAYGEVKSAISFLEETLDINPEFYDAYLGLGIFNYTLSYIPGFYRFLIGILGLSSDKEEGLKQIKIASEKGGINKFEAHFYLARIYTDYLADFDTAKSILEKLLFQFPYNTVLQYQFALTLLLNRDLEKSEETLDGILEIMNPEFQQTNSFAFLRKGDILFKKNEFEKAIEFYNLFLSKTRSFEYSGYAYYQLALCYSIIGNETESKRNLLFARGGNLDISEDFYAKEKSEYFYRNGFSGNYLKLIKIENLIENKMLSEAEKKIENALPSLTSNELMAKANLLKGEINFEKRDFEYALTFLLKVFNYKLEYDRWLIPKSHLLAAESFYHLDNIESALEYLEEAEDNNEFEFQEQIQAKINNLKKRIENVGKN